MDDKKRSEKEGETSSRLPFPGSDSSGGATNQRRLTNGQPARTNGVEQVHPFAAADPSLHRASRIHGQNQQSSVAFGAGAFTNRRPSGLQPSTSSSRNYSDGLNEMISSINLRAGQEFPSGLGGRLEFFDPRFSYHYHSNYINAGGARERQGRSLDAFYPAPHHADATASYPNYSFPGPSSFLGNGNAFTGLPTHPDLDLNPLRNSQAEFNRNRTIAAISQRSSSSMPPNFNLAEFDAARNSNSPSPPHLPIEFDANLRDLKDQIYEMAKDRKFTQFLQTKLDGRSPQDVGIIFNELFTHLSELMVDPYACRVLQKLFEVCDGEQRMKIVLLLTQDPRKLSEISIDASGTKTVQKLIGSLGTREQVEKMKLALEPFCLKYMKDAHGYHVISQCLKCFTEEYKQFIFETAEIHCVELAKDQSGCVILQDCLRMSTGLIKTILIEEITANGLQLARDKFGNYVLQLALDFSPPTALSTLASLFSGHYSDLSTDKCSSNVVEKCLKCFSTTDREKIVNELLSAPQFEQLLQHPYANYVIQSALVNTKGSVHSKLVQEILLHIQVLLTNPHSKGILSILKKY